MTTILQQMQTGPVRANEIFAKLADTSPTALKTRERLFSELKAEIDRQADFEEQRLFPVLEKHEETKDLVGGALDENRRMRELLAEVERDPKDSEAFGPRLAELRDIFQQHLRDDGKDVLPAMAKALNDDEAGTADGKAEDAATENTPARRADAGEHRHKDGHEQAGVDRQGAKIMEAGADLAQQGARMARMAKEAGADRAGEGDRAARAMTAPEETQDIAGKADLASVGRSMVALLNDQARHAIQAQTIMAAGRARTLAEVAQVQSAFIADSFQRMGQFNDRYLAFIRSWRGLLFFPSSHR